jgi:hypothetical protein
LGRFGATLTVIPGRPGPSPEFIDRTAQEEAISAARSSASSAFMDSGLSLALAPE